MARSKTQIITPGAPISPLKDEELKAEIAKRLKLAMLQTGAWRATVKNKEESRILNERHGTKDEGKVTVRQCDHTALHEIYSLHARVYNEHKKLTLPSVQDGVRIVLTGKEFEHSDMIRKFADDVRVQIDKLIDAGAYVDGDEYKKAKQRLNGLFDERAWPIDEQDLRNRFLLKSTYLECPTDGSWGDWIMESATAARREVEEQVEKALRKVIERCAGDKGDGTGRLHESVFTNLGSMLDVLSTIDVEARYRPVVEEAKEVAKYTAEEIRKDSATRKQLAERADKLTDMFAGLRR